MSTTTMTEITTLQPSKAYGNGFAASSATAHRNPRSEHAPSKRKTATKYRHVAAVHPTARTSWLSHDSEQSPSFLGFRNLMVIVLGWYLILFYINK